MLILLNLYLTDKSTMKKINVFTCQIKGIVHFEINFCYVLAYLKGIQGVGVFVSAVVSILIFLGQTVLVCQSMQVYGHHIKGHVQRSPN